MGKFLMIVVFFMVGSVCIIPVHGVEPDPDEAEVYIGATLASRYMWRGVLLSDGAVLQPYMELSYKGFVVGAEGSSTIQAFAWQETDLYIGYSWNNFQLTIFDYYYYPEHDEDHDFFDYSSDTTLHTLEAVFEYLGTENFPVRLLGGYNFYGADDANSLYFEAALMLNARDIDIEFFAGYTPHSGYYHETKKGFTSVGVMMQRNLFSGRHFDMPFAVSLVYSPMIRKTTLVLAVGID